MERKSTRRKMYVMWSTFVVLTVATVIFFVSIYAYNHTSRHCDAGEQNDAFSVGVAARTGQTDSWDKIVYENGEELNYKGAIYDVTVKNIGANAISVWNLKIDITQDVYLNNAWCGKVEVHQFSDGNERIQKIDLRNYTQDELQINYKIANPDLLISLHAGDYLIYYPDLETNEYPILSGDSNKLTQVVFGMIFYNQAGMNVEFNDLHMTYCLERKYTKNLVFWILCIGYIIWLIALIAFASVEVNMKKAKIRFEQDEHIIRQSIGVFTHFFEAKDIYTNGHSQRVAKYARLIARKMELPEDQVRQFYYIGLMHDCGKCYIPDEILKKTGKLTDEEYEMIKSHTIKGADMLEHFESIEHIRDGVLYHHERYDGKGYPEGLSGKNIPLIARIICVADSFDAMNSRRCYRDRLSKEKIISEIKNNKGKQFDPYIADVFLKLVNEGEIQIL